LRRTFQLAVSTANLETLKALLRASVKRGIPTIGQPSYK